MRPLDADTIRDIKRALEDRASSLFALETPTGVALSNRHLFLEWPHELVDPCKQLEQLMETDGNDKWQEALRQIDWRQEFIGHCDFLQYVEVDPDHIPARELQHLGVWGVGADSSFELQDFPYYGAQYGPSIVYYQRELVHAVEVAFEPDMPERVLYEETRPERQACVLMTVFDDGALVGVLLNTPTEMEETLVTDNETGKAAVVMRRRR